MAFCVTVAACTCLRNEREPDVIFAHWSEIASVLFTFVLPELLKHSLTVHLRERVMLHTHTFASVTGIRDRFMALLLLGVACVGFATVFHQLQIAAGIPMLRITRSTVPTHG